MAASDFENPRRDERWDESKAQGDEHGAYREGYPDRSDPTHRFDPDYHEWRAEQMRQLDKDYALWRQERYRKFAEEFETWRRQRFSGERRLAPDARAGVAGPSFPPAARSTAGGFRGPTFGSANALGTHADSPTAEPGALRPRPERSERPEAADRGADRSDRPERTDRPEKSGSILSGLLGTGSNRK